jgi:hypothetical protein
MTAADALGATLGFVLVTAGVWLVIGVGPALIVAGCLLLTAALWPKNQNRPRGGTP